MNETLQLYGLLFEITKVCDNEIAIYKDDKCQKRSQQGFWMDQNTNMINAKNEVNKDSGACPICMEELVDEDDTNSTICAHKFHVACLDRWRHFGCVNCPLCRMIINFDKSESVHEVDATYASTRSEIHNDYIASNSRVRSFRDSLVAMFSREETEIQNKGNQTNKENQRLIKQ
jgi:hypothetical protein